MLMLAKTAFQRSQGGAASAPGHSNLTFRAAPIDANDLATYTFSSQAIGTAAADRWVIVAAASSASSTPTSMTIGGVTASVVIGSGSAGVSIWSALVPTGTTANIVCNFTLSARGCLIGYWTVNMADGVATFTAEFAVSGQTVQQTINIPANGFCIDHTWTFGSSDFAHSIDASFIEQAENFTGQANAAYSHREIVGGAVTGVTVTDTWDSGDSVTGSAFASWK